MGVSMKFIQLKISDLKIDCLHEHDLILKMAREYMSQHDKADMKIEPVVHALPQDYSEAYKEVVCLLVELAEQLPVFERVLFHGAAIEYDNHAYVFAAPSKTGKSTHITLWKLFLKEKVDIINGDKPIFHVHDEIVDVYGSPWSGKENWNRNTCVPLAGICFLKQGNLNQITKLNTDEAMQFVLSQMYVPKDEERAGKVLEMLDVICRCIPIFLMECEISEQAVQMSFEALTKKDYVKEIESHENEERICNA